MQKHENLWKKAISLVPSPALALSYLRLVITVYLCPMAWHGVVTRFRAQKAFFFEKKDKHFPGRESIVVVKKSMLRF